MDTALLLIGIVGLVFVFRFMARQNNEIIHLLENLNEKDVAPGRPTDSPNKLGKTDPNILSFDENNPLTIPRDVKFEIEGGDATIPFEYTNA